MDLIIPKRTPRSSTCHRSYSKLPHRRCKGEETHFREVFDRFVATQEECGAPVNGLTFDKFVRKLHAAREQVMKRHDAASVRFTVYVKDGRAALKASPVKQ